MGLGLNVSLIDIKQPRTWISALMLTGQQHLEDICVSLQCCFLLHKDQKACLIELLTRRVSEVKGVINWMHGSVCGELLSWFWHQLQCIGFSPVPNNSFIPPAYPTILTQFCFLPGLRVRSYGWWVQPYRTAALSSSQFKLSLGARAIAQS